MQEGVFFKNYPLGTSKIIKSPPDLQGVGSMHVLVGGGRGLDALTR